MHQSPKIISFDKRKFLKTIVNVLIDIKLCSGNIFWKLHFFHLIWATNMLIDILYPVNMHVIRISLRKIDIYIKITCKAIYRVSFNEKIKFNN